MSRRLRDVKIETYLQSLEDCDPTFDAYLSEDECESDEEEYTDSAELLTVLQDLNTDSLNVTPTTSYDNEPLSTFTTPQETSTVEENIVYEESSPELNFETDASDDDEPEWLKSPWIEYPDLHYFDSRSLRPKQLFPSRSTPYTEKIEGNGAISYIRSITKIIRYLSKPKHIIHDPDKLMDYLTYKEHLTSLLTIDVHQTSARHHKSNRDIERLHSTIIKKYRVMRELHPDEDKEELMALTITSYNCTEHSVTKCTPHQALFDIEPNQIEVPDEALLLQNYNKNATIC
ncbi:Retrovirus-related Pol polyprotein from transposon opus [Eumeta japonica]|uniref:Retrovirus-related Pol polyprotein from transposon opus n=1 Tax=Eumeta variegata TaxID=151549 RepID=A0A4C2A502_EUMVA|nr:Retrovirus-related Pol polyprotein from transposon opus [Eumeta japonica]